MKNLKSLVLYVFFTASALALNPGEGIVFNSGVGVQSTENYAFPMVFDSCTEPECSPQGPLVLEDKTFPVVPVGSSRSQGVGATAFTLSPDGVTEPCAYFNTYYDANLSSAGLCQDGYNFGNALTILTVPQGSLQQIKDVLSPTDTGLSKENGEPLVLDFINSGGFVFETSLTAYAPRNFQQKLYLFRESDLESMAIKHGKSYSLGSNFAYLDKADVESLDRWELSLIIKEEAGDNVMRRFGEIKCRQLNPNVQVELVPAYGTSNQYACRLTRENLTKKIEIINTITKDTPIVNSSCNDIYLNRGDSVLKSGVYQLTKTYKYYVYDNVQPYSGGYYFTVPHNPEIADGQYVYFIVDGKIYDGIWWDGKYRTLDERPVHARFDGVNQINPTFTWGGQQVIVIPKKHKYTSRWTSFKRGFVPVIQNRVLDVSKNSPAYPLTLALQEKFSAGITDHTKFVDSQLYFSINEDAYCDMETDGGGWTLVASSANRAVWQPMTYVNGLPEINRIPELMAPYINHELYGDVSTFTTSDYKGEGYLSVPFAEFMFKDSNSKWASYEIGEKNYTSVRDWYPNDTFWVANGVKPTESSMKPNGLYLFKAKRTNVPSSSNICGGLDIGFNMEDSDSAYGSTLYHDYGFGPAWFNRNNNSCYFDDGGLKWYGGTIFNRTSPSTYRLWFVRSKSENRKGKLYSSCYEILKDGKSKGDGLYNLDIDGTGYPTKTFCNMSVDGGGWTLVAKFSNQDEKHWSITPKAWTDEYSFGSPSSSAPEDMKNKAWNNVKARDILFLADNLKEKAFWTNDGCAKNMTMREFFNVGFASHNFTNYNTWYRNILGQTKYKTCKVSKNYNPEWTKAYTFWGRPRDSIMIEGAIHIARNDSYDSHGVISTFPSTTLEADAGLGSLDWNYGFTTTGSAQDVGSPSLCGLNDEQCRVSFPQTVYMYVRESNPQDKLAERIYNSCAEIQATNPTEELRNDYYYIFSRVRNVKTKVWCDFTVTPALTLFHKSNALRTYRFTDWDSCKEDGFQIFAPRNKSELLAGISYLENEVKGAPQVDTMELGPLGVYNPYRNSTYYVAGGFSAFTPMNSTSAAPSQGWRSIRGNEWFVSDTTTSGEPNGDYFRNCWLGIKTRTDGVSSYNDSSCNYSYTSYMCSTNETVDSDFIYNQDALVPLYSFTSHVFRSCGKTGPYGPTLSQCRTAYSASPWSANPAFFTMSRSGYQTWTVPENGTYRIRAAGARGGFAVSYGRTSGYHYGATLMADFVLHKGDKLTMVIGQPGLDHGSHAGGGGGTFVTIGANYANSKPLLIAGGGGGQSTNYSRINSQGTVSANGQDVTALIRTSFWSSYYLTVKGGTGGKGGGGQTGNTLARGGGGGFLTNGIGDRYGYAFRTGAYGANGCNGDGGFGGGSSSCSNHGGAGGGYSGGASGYSYSNGGGGGSYFDPYSKNRWSRSGSQGGSGYVLIQKL